MRLADRAFLALKCDCCQLQCLGIGVRVFPENIGDFGIVCIETECTNNRCVDTRSVRRIAIPRLLWRSLFGCWLGA